ncbi:methyltransferase [archaeon]|nr:methyltransferase [archaeon]
MTELVYEPREDSLMLQYQVERFAKGKVLDMGTGSGVQAYTASQRENVTSVTAVDVSKRAIKHAQEHNKHQKINYHLSDLFSRVKGKFDTIIFNPPYLPQDHKIRRRALEGGKKGYEVIQKFLEKVSDYLEPEGLVLLVLSSLSNKQKVEEILRESMLEFEELSSKHLFFETLFVYLIKKSEVLKKLEQEDITKVHYFAKGKRGMVYKGECEGKIVCIKVKRKANDTYERIRDESKFLQVLNKHNLGPKYLFSDQHHLVYEFVPGENIRDYLETASKEDARKVLITVLKQCKKIDELGINKEEMHHPVKHVIIGKKIVMIDFERCRFTEEPKNVTQFMQYIMMNIPLLKNKKIDLDSNKIISLTKEYKREMNEKSFKRILSYLKNSF